MKVTLTSMQGNTRDIVLQNKQEVYDFIDLFCSTMSLVLPCIDVILTFI